MPPHRADLNGLGRRIDDRLDKLEEKTDSKLEDYLKKLVEHNTNLIWIQAYIKISITAIIALAAGLLQVLFGNLK